MRIALLGVDDTTLAVAAAAVSSNEHEIVLIDGLARRANEAMAVAPRAKLFTEWEALLSGAGFEVILLAADDPGIRIEQLRRLIQLQRGIVVLVSHPLSMSMLESFEMEMIREESASVVMPYLPARFHPAIDELQNLIDHHDDSAIGIVEQIMFQRGLASRERESVRRQFARDADILQVLAGQTSRLHAFASGPEAATAGFQTKTPLGEGGAGKRNEGASDLRNLIVQTTGDGGLVCRWTVVPATDQTAATLTLIGSQGEANLRMTDDKRPWRLEVRSAQESTVHEYPGWDPAAVMLVRLAKAYQTPGDVVPAWADAARTVELAETIDRSLARGRTIELHEEEFSDISTFKGTMTSVGCGLLVAGVFLAVLVAILHLVAIQAGWNQLAGMLDHWPYLLLAVCGIYLLLQTLVFVGKPRQKDGKTTSPGQAQDEERQSG